MNDNVPASSIGDEAVDIANAIGEVMSGRNTAAGYAALGMVIGYSASLAERPDLDRLLTLIGRTAQAEFDRRKPKR